VDNLFNNQNRNLHKELSGSKRRSRLNLGIASLPDFGCFAGADSPLGIIEMVCSQGHQIANDAAFGTSQANVQTEKSQTLGSAATPKLQQSSLNSQLQLSEVLGNDKLEDKNRWKLLRRSKQLLAVRTVTPELALRLDLRR